MLVDLGFVAASGFSFDVDDGEPTIKELVDGRSSSWVPLLVDLSEQAGTSLLGFARSTRPRWNRLGQVELSFRDRVMTGEHLDP